MNIRKHLVSSSVAEKVTNGKGNTKRYITIHETDNQNKGADADAHARLQANGNSRKASWHWTVDDKESVQSFDHSYKCWAAGSSNGNNQSIQVEICVNSDGDYSKAVQNAAELVKSIMKQEGISINNVVQHNHWSGKNCPSVMRGGKKITWTQFKAMLVGTSSAATRDYLMLNDRGEQVKALQDKLTRLGYDMGGVDGIYGKATANAVMILQRRTGLVPDGLAGRETISMVDLLLKRDTQETGDDKGKYRIFTGVFDSKKSAEAAASLIREKVGLNPFIRKEE